MKKGFRALRICLLGLALLGTFHEAFAASLNLTLTRTSAYSRVDFDSAYTMVWSGDIFYSGFNIGEFNAVLTKTNTSGAIGYVTQYDLVIVVPGAGPVPEFVSIRTTHITAGSGADHGIIFASSPALKSYVGATVVMTGSSVTVTY